MSKLAILGGEKTIVEKGPHFVWPPISKNTEKAVVKQLHKSISVYDRSGIIKKFETDFINYQQTKYALVTNNGTSAIHSMYFGVGIGFEDEVICPVYTYYGTVSPLLSLGAHPIFCDCDDTGNINPTEIEKHITAKTKAVVVTHMWGIPAKIDVIQKICQKHGIVLLEDCSHAHGAEYHGKKLGNWGLAAAWSLQAHKIVFGGEAGVMATNDKEVFLRSMILGNNFKRCEQEIPQNHYLAKYSTSGVGIKYRAHPLAVAIATEQLDRLDSWIEQKNIFAKKMIKDLSKLPGIKTPIFSDGSQPAWYQFAMQFVSEELGGLSLSKFISAVQAEGATDIRQPDSPFCSLNTLPLFQNPKEFFGWYNGPTYSDDGFPVANKISNSVVTLPVWVNRDDEKIVNSYIMAIVKVIKNYKELI